MTRVVTPCSIFAAHDSHSFSHSSKLSKFAIRMWQWSRLQRGHQCQQDSDMRLLLIRLKARQQKRCNGLRLLARVHPLDELVHYLSCECMFRVAVQDFLRAQELTN